MLQAQQVEELIRVVSALDRDTLIQHFTSYRATFPVDFTPDFLTAQSVDRLRHIFLAMCLHCQRLPETPAPTPHAA